MVLSPWTSSRRQISGLMCRKVMRSWQTTGTEDAGGSSIPPSWPLQPPPGSLPQSCSLSHQAHEMRVRVWGRHSHTVVGGDRPPQFDSMSRLGATERRRSLACKGASRLPVESQI